MLKTQFSLEGVFCRKKFIFFLLFVMQYYWGCKPSVRAPQMNRAEREGAKCVTEMKSVLHDISRFFFFIILDYTQRAVDPALGVTIQFPANKESLNNIS